MDDRLYSETEEADTTAGVIQDEGGKEQKPDIDIHALIAETPENQVKDQKVIEAEEIVPSIKLAEFVRDTSNLARAHEFSRTSEPELGMS